MHFITHSHRNAQQVLENIPDYARLWAEISAAIEAIDEEMLMKHFQDNYESKGKGKSISYTINSLLKEQLTVRGWASESRIFGEKNYSEDKKDKKWRLDFAKSVSNGDPDEVNRSLEPKVGISIEVAFNNDGSTAWNLIKPVLAGELNHVKKETQAGVGVIITATEALKRAGGFDNAVGTFDDFLLHLRPMRNILTVPLLIVGLQPMDSFKIRVAQTSDGKRGFVENI
jgi:hypothetical protein